MAENSSNGHANGDTPHETQPLAPRVRAPEGTRSARALDGSPVEIVAQNQAPDDLAHADLEELADAPSPENVVQSDAPDWRTLEIAAPLGIDIEESDDELPAYDSYPLAAPDDEAEDELDGGGGDAELAAPYVDDIEGQQLFAGNAETDPLNDEDEIALVDAQGAGGGGDEPPFDNGLATSGGAGRPDTPRDQELGLMEHLRELRSRLIYGVLGVALMMCLTWHYSNQLQGWFSAPILKVLNANGVYRGSLISTDPTAFFTLYFQFSLFSALILAMPWVLFQVWRFIEPAMTHSERRYTLVLVPFSSVLFFLGAGLGYAVSPLFFQFFLQFQPPGVAAQWKYDDSILLMVKMLLIFGLAFQVPIIIIFGHKIGLISRNLLIEYWRHAVVVIFVVVAILTPTWDPVTLTACALPPCLLYLLSIWLVKWL